MEERLDDYTAAIMEIKEAVERFERLNRITRKQVEEKCLTAVAYDDLTVA